MIDTLDDDTVRLEGEAGKKSEVPDSELVVIGGRETPEVPTRVRGSLLQLRDDPSRDGRIETIEVSDRALSPLD